MSQPMLQSFEFDIVTVNADGQEISHKRKQAQYLTEDLDNGVELSMVSIPAGSFLMGSPESEFGRMNYFEIPQHRVAVAPCFIGQYPVTQAQWQAVATLPTLEHDLKSVPSAFQGNQRPVERVSWLEAAEFCARLSLKTGREYRLPSEAEWEYACRAGTKSPFHFGETITTDLANYNGTALYASALKGLNRKQTTDVGSFPPNAFGLYDMHGNVWEWCLDHWNIDYEGAPTDGSAWIANRRAPRRRIRGGSWLDDPRHCRSASRADNHFNKRNNYIGFRVVCAAP